MMVLLQDRSSSGISAYGTTMLLIWLSQFVTLA